MKILIIEDSLCTAMYMAETLLSKGHKVKIFGLKPKIKDIMPWEDKRMKYRFEEDSFLLPETALKANAQIRAIDADLVMLDERLNMPYVGSELVPGCEGKKILGISRDGSPSGVWVNWPYKQCFENGTSNAADGWYGFFETIDAAMKK